MCSLEISFLFWCIVIGGQARTSRASIEAPAHTLKKCLQKMDSNNTIVCEDFIPETGESISQWPAGPYVLPITRHGCPESPMHGWREGYLSITWQTSQSVHVLTKNLDAGETAKFINVKDEPFFSTSDRHIFIPANTNELKLSFCYKLRSNLSVDIGAWPDGNFSIYATGNGCPPEFEKHYSNLSLPNISRLESHGYLPDFKLFNDGIDDVLQMQLCSRRTAFNTSVESFENDDAAAVDFFRTPERERKPHWTSFFLIKGDNVSCPTFQHSVMTEETVYLEQYRHNDLQMLKASDTLCYYEIKTSSDDTETWLLEKRLKSAYSVYVASITEDFISPVNKYKYWKIADLGRTVAVSAVDITDNTDNNELCSSAQFQCFISREKWDFLYAAALLCPYLPICRIRDRSVSLLFTRIMGGRYVALSYDDADNELDELIINVFTEHVSYDGLNSCNTDLGMSDLGIKDDQISASSSLPEFTPNKARPYYSGWCPDFDDQLSYIQIDFPKTTTIEGITVYYSREAVLSLSIEVMKAVSFGRIEMFLYAEDFNHSLVNNKTLIIDTSKTDTTPQTFWFLKTIQAKFVKLVINKGTSDSSAMTCIRFELHGCKPNESFQALNAFVRKQQIAFYEVVAFTSEIYEDGSLLTSFGYPDHYQTNQAFKWIISYPDFHFIKLVFTHIELNTRKGSADNMFFTCNDSLIISNALADDSDFTRIIDHRYNGVKYSIAVETQETQIVLSFVTCLIYSPTDQGNGFRAFATHEKIPACFSLRPNIPWHEGLQETCRQSSMLITSMTYLGFSFEETIEQWTIHIPMKRIHVQIIDFYVPCQNELYKSEFKIINMGQEKSYCNIERPPDSFNSSFDMLTVYFYKGPDPWHKIYVANVVGFRMIYSTIHQQEKERLIDYKDAISQVRNVALGKPATMTTTLYKSYKASVGTDGLTFQEWKSGSCFETPDWWLVDLQNTYTMYYAVLHSVIGGSTPNKCPISLSTGSTIWDIRWTADVCGDLETSRTVHLDGIKARYLKLQQECEEQAAFFSLCEVQVYGELESGLVDTSWTESSFPTRVHGEWGKWSAWTDVCYCEGFRYRHRLCDNPKPQFSGNNCPGNAFSKRPCTLVTSHCEVYDGPKTQPICEDNVSDNIGLSSWTEWSKCSSECGHGLISRTRNCKRPGSNGTIKHCTEDIIESRPCKGNGSCLACSQKFQKCYSIISRLTNWKQARLECLSRNMSLVSMLTLSEMRFIKYMLRERRYTDGLPTNYFGADFYVHIGLSLGSKLSYEIPTWENGFQAAYFTAWNMKKSSSGNCTRMNYQLFDNDYTWEHEDCVHTLAEYTMCEYQQQGSRILPVKSLSTWEDKEMEEIAEQISTSEYEGNISITMSGKMCDDSQCQVNAGLHYLACPTVDGVWEECNIKLPARPNSSIVYHTYLGHLSTSFSGKLCQRWDIMYPHRHEIDRNLFKGESISDAGNHCRDLGGMGFLWCFTTDAETRWEPCVLNEIKAERRCITSFRYTGRKNTTITGKSCLRWNVIGLKNVDFPEMDIVDAVNYCRDPYNFGYNWCYVDSPLQNQEWEPCNIKESQSIRQTDDISLESSHNNTLMCDVGRIIPQYLRCDGKFDCQDKFDEKDCSYAVHPMMRTFIKTNISSSTNSTIGSSLEWGSYFECKTQELISIIAMCDGVIDCFDASDETGCNDDIVENQACTKEQFQCAVGDCIHISLVCNFVDDCIDGSDEYCVFEQCSSLTEYRCNNGPCIPLEQRCDAVQQCIDGSDELACDECQSEVAFHCDVVRCIPKRLKCDKYVHCKDGTDEQSCDIEIFTSCQDVWERGYRKSGHYIIGGVRMECQFGDIFRNSTIGTVLNFDLLFWKYFLNWFGTVIIRADLYNIPATKKEHSMNFVIFYKDGSRCIQQIKEVCVPSYENIAKLNDSTNPCFCGIINFEIKKKATHEPFSYKSIEKCKNIGNIKWTSSVERPVPLTAYIGFIQTIGYRSIPNIRRDYQIIAGSAICVQGNCRPQEYNAEDNDFVCDINGKHIPAHLQCIYDIDETGFPVGCRDGSHLNNCEKFECPLNTVKCADSYCLPLRFLCDGEPQCPGGDDEESCGCSPSKNEILILYDEESADGPDVDQFARQFRTRTNIVRLLSYKATRPLQTYGISSIFLEIRDTEINIVPDIESSFECRYKIKARKLLESVHFTNDELKGVILIESSEISYEVVNEIFERVSYLKPDFRIYRVTENSNATLIPTFDIPTSEVIDIRVKRWRLLNGIGAEYFSVLCNVTSKLHCHGGYKCASSKTCIPLEQVCDGYKHCLHGDDEGLCNFRCPDKCTCVGLVANCSATDFDLSMLHKVPNNTRYLDFSLNKKLNSTLVESVLNFRTLSILSLSDCDIKVISRYAFERIRNLRSLDLSFNKLITLPNYVFSSLKRLAILNLRGNFQLSVIKVHAFHGLFLIRDLDLANAKLKEVAADTFAGLKLRKLDLSNNTLEELEDFAFRDASVEHINFKRNNIKQFNTEIFTGVIGLKNLITPEFKYCCIRPNYVHEEDCYPHQDEFSSCDDLMRHSVLQFLIWLIGIAGLLGNLLTFIYRLKYDRKRLKLGFGIFVTNLAVADFLMAIYLVIIAVADSVFRKRYIFFDDYWRHSVWCNLAGILSTISSESSVLFLCLITLDRILVIKFPFGGVKLSTEKAVACVTLAWLFSASVAIFPVAYEGYFKNEFYSRSGVCIALPLTRDRPPGWIYSLTLFVCLNFLTFVLVAIGQFYIFVEIHKSAGIATSVEQARKRDLKVARNLLLVVATDFMCWFPIGVMGMLALTGHVISGDVYAWAAVFILPINSALNPILYTLSALIGGKNFNPSTDEQSLTKITKDIGESAIRCSIASRRLTTRKTIPMFRNLSEIAGEEMQIPLNAVLTIAAKLAQTLDAFHSYSLGINALDLSTVIVGIRRNKLTGSVKIKGVPFVSYKSEDKTSNINQLGVILRSLIAMRKSSKS